MPISADALAQQLHDKPLPLARLAVVLWSKGKKEEARVAALRVLEVAGDGHPEAVMVARDILARDVPKWHFSIIRDQRRNDLYEAALKRLVRPGSHVLEIGTGTGILSMMAARAGAERVTTCEMNPSVAEAATRIIAKNGYADRVTVVPKKSDDALVGEDIDGRADLLVQEIISNDLLGEAVLPAMEDAVKRLLKPGARMIPDSVTARVALVDDTRAVRHRMGEVSGFDLGGFDHLAQVCQRVGADSSRFTLRSAVHDLMHFDLRSGGPYPGGRAMAKLTATGGRVAGVVQWLKMDMDGTGELIYENRPDQGLSSCWAVRFFPFDAPRDLPAGAVVKIGATHDRNTIMIWCEEIEASAESAVA
ncbi:50S ribosomal protein L11 methyltransferase [Tistrella mobilis]|uniref:TPR domain-containing protein n=1 Tax=Tistrella mobilis (strain KA081020-065) TaxID=1110502 RepID=I3TUU3_TISMK|nr:50S ribosomal protein L11 methyltransferase [Tistrella mobilis]AFK56531.1 TPR domain-containing protein [Tistrella mobilis KA081020-065]